ncbi:MAG: hypothetical protein KBT47_02625, partial [Armatimonadetes bacterium]|nr:hypothetical protein [Candidatus Hippobium faecium]
RVYIYAFFDEGTDPLNSEHHFGLIDYYCQKKPSYYAVKNLCSQIGDMTYKEPVKGTDSPVFGYTFSDGKETVSVIWNAEKEQKAIIKTSAESVTVTDMLGETVKNIKSADGKITVRIGPSPVFIRYSGSLEIESFKDIQAINNTLDISLPQEDYIVKKKINTEIEINVTNSYAEPVRGVSYLMKDSEKLSEKAWTVAGGKTEKINLDYVSSENEPSLDPFSVYTVYEADDMTFENTQTVYIRNISDKKDLYSAEIGDLCILGNDRIEISVAPTLGGRICEIIDKKNLTNQLHLNYKELPNLKSYFWTYTLWDEFLVYENDTDNNMKFVSRFKNDSFDYKINNLKDSIKLEMTS